VRQECSFLGISRPPRMARSLHVTLAIALVLCSALIASALDRADTKDPSFLESQTATSVRAQLQVAHKARAAVAVAAKSTVQAAVAATVSATAQVKGDVDKPWEFLTTNTSITMTWIAFALLIVIVAALGTIIGCLLRTYCGEGKSKSFDIETSAHSIYNS